MACLLSIITLVFQLGGTSIPPRKANQPLSPTYLSLLPLFHFECSHDRLFYLFLFLYPLSSNDQTNKQDPAQFDGSFFSLTCPLISFLLSCYSIELLFFIPPFLLFISQSIYWHEAPLLLRLGFNLRLKECIGLIHFVRFIFSLTYRSFPLHVQPRLFRIQYLLACLRACVLAWFRL